MRERDVDTSCADTISDLGDANSVAHGVVSTALVTGLTLIDPRRLRPWQRLIYRINVAWVASWMMSASLRSDSRAQGEATDLSPELRSGLTAATFGITMAASELGEAFDAKIHDSLVRRGVKRPRLVLAALAVVIGVGTWALSRSRETQTS